jgi:hypothetical protein
MIRARQRTFEMRPNPGRARLLGLGAKLSLQALEPERRLSPPKLEAQASHGAKALERLFRPRALARPGKFCLVVNFGFTFKV